MEDSDTAQQPDPPARRLVTIDVAASLLSMGRSKTCELIASRDLESVKIGRSRRIPVDALDQFVARLRDEAARS
ncbi:MAG: excisionase family DNA-binding protein [Actinomycetota bacterium]